MKTNVEHQTLCIAFAWLHINDDDSDVIVIIVTALILLDQLWQCEDDSMDRMWDTCQVLHIGFLGLCIIASVADLVGLNSPWEGN
jgi:hypothetical protein